MVPANGATTLDVYQPSSARSVTSQNADFVVSLRRSLPEQVCGVRLTFSADNTSMSVTALKEQGLVPDYNIAMLDPRKRVMPGDHITSINGIFGDAEKMFDRLQDQTITLRVRRLQPSQDVNTRAKV
jgi:hypothetical protein